MKLILKNKSNKEKPYKAELVVDVGGLTEDEADELIDMIERRVSIKSRTDRVRPCDLSRKDRGYNDRQVIDVNINVNRD